MRGDWESTARAWLAGSYHAIAWHRMEVDRRISAFLGRIFCTGVGPWLCRELMALWLACFTLD